MNIEQAGEALNEKLKAAGIAAFVGIGEVLFVYLNKHYNDKLLTELSNQGFEGHKVRVEYVGEIKPA